MSTDQQRFRHSRRRLNDSNAVKRQLKIAKRAGVVVDQPGRFIKQHALDCGHTQCLVCSGHKVLGEPGIQQKRLSQDVDNPRSKHSNGKATNED
jgi:hypothetical protein